MTVIESRRLLDEWIAVARREDLEPDRGVAARLGTEQIALFVLSGDDAVFAIGNRDPFSGANVLARGIVGDRAGEPKVASPIYKQNFSLRTGICLDDPTVSVPLYEARVPRWLHRGAAKMSLALGPTLLPLQDGEQYRFVFDMNACIGCHSCEVACAEQNNLPVEVAWRKVGEIEGGEFPATKRFNLSMACNHCLEPTCLEGCPTGAYTKLSNGIVQHHADDCIGCQYCTWNCPYSVPVFHEARKIVSKCDMCLPRLEGGFTSACVDACPTHAIGIEIVNVAEWRADHRAADGPNLPSSDITISTTRIVLPTDVPLETFAASDYDVRPEHPHWSLVAVTLLMQVAMGTVASLAVGGVNRATSITAFTAAAISLPVSLFHLGRPILAWKAIRGIRRSWLSREVAAFGAFAMVTLSVVAVPSRAMAIAALVVGLVAVACSGRLYMVRGRPAWDTPLTLVAFFLSGLAAGPLLAMASAGASLLLRCLAFGAILGQLVVLTVSALRLRSKPAREWHGSYRLLTSRFRSLLIGRVLLALAGACLALFGPPIAAFVVVCAGEVIGRYLFYVTVVPLSTPGTFAGATR